MKKLFLALIAAGLLAAPVAAQPIPLYENFGQVTYRIDIPEEAPPVIDALAFANYGTFEITNVVKFSTLGALDDLGLPYEPNNVLNFTNRGRMQAMFGFRFNNATESGRRPAASFVNANNGIIDALGIVQDEPDPFANLNVFTLPILANSYVEINATNIVNHGLLESDNQGLIRLEGQNV